MATRREEKSCLSDHLSDMANCVEVKSGMALSRSGTGPDSSGSQVLTQGQSPRLMSIDKAWASAFKPNSLFDGGITGSDLGVPKTVNYKWSKINKAHLSFDEMSRIPIQCLRPPLVWNWLSFFIYCIVVGFIFSFCLSIPFKLCPFICTNACLPIIPVECFQENNFEQGWVKL